jgi:hypothetical protein
VVRVLDPSALDARAKEPRGRASIVVPTAWLREGARLELELPKRLRCDLCDGGGCDACASSGAYRLEIDAAKAMVSLTLPRVTDDHLALRITNPVATTEGAPKLLVVHVAAGEAPSPGVRYVGPNHDVEPAARGPAGVFQLPQLPNWAKTALLVVLAAALALVARCAFG